MSSRKHQKPQQQQQQERGGDDLDDDFYIMEPIRASGPAVDSDDASDAGEILPGGLGDDADGLHEGTADGQGKEEVKKSSNVHTAVHASRMAQVLGGPTEEAKSAKKKRKRKALDKLKEKKAKKFASEAGDLGDSSVGNLKPAEQAEFLWRHLSKHCMGDKTSVEIGDVKLQTTHIGGSPVRDRHLAHLVPFVKSLNKEWKSLFAHPSADAQGGSPTLLIVTHSRQRVLDLAEALAMFEGKGKNAIKNGAPIAKLFSKFQKVPQQQAFLKNKVCIAIGTSQRMEKLRSLDALQLGSLKHIVFDMGKDGKGFTIFHHTYVKDILAFIWPQVYQRVLDGQAKISFF